MHDTAIPASRLITIALWTASVVVLVISWVVWLRGNQSLAVMIGTTAIIIVAAAAVSQIRCYQLRICRLVRMVGGLEPTRSDLHAVH